MRNFTGNYLIMKKEQFATTNREGNDIVLYCIVSHYQMLLIKFATAFVPFMEELGGYHYLPAPPARPNERQSPLRMMPPPATTDKTGEEVKSEGQNGKYGKYKT